MYFELTAPNVSAFTQAVREAELLGLDPEIMTSLTFSIGTGNIEKVSRIRDKFNLTETYLSEQEPTGYQRS